MKTNFNGLLSALVTPYTSTGEVNYKELKKLVRYLIDKGIDGFYVGGSTAEAFLLTQDERKHILEAVLEENNGEKTVVAHVGQISTDFAVDLSCHAKTAGADAISAISPFYYKFSLSEIKSYYFDIVDRSQMPMFIYNFPAFSGFNLTAELLGEFLVNPNIIGVKFTSSDFYQMERMKTLYPNIYIWNGFDEMLLPGLAAGADGGVGSTYNCIYPIIRNIYDSHKHGQHQTALQYQKQANHIIQVICRHGVFQSVKALLELEGFTMGGCRKPFNQLSNQGRLELKAVYEQYTSVLME